MTLNLLLMPKFIEDGWEVHYIGDKRGIEHQEIPQVGFRCHLSIPLRLENCDVISLGKICWTSSKLVGELSNLSLSCCDSVHKHFFQRGGFVSVPPVIAARVSGVPVFIHESDLSMGLANKIAYKFATKMYSTFEQASSLSKVEHVGAVTKVSDQKNPEPDELVDIQTHFNPKLPTVLIIL